MIAFASASTGATESIKPKISFFIGAPSQSTSSFHGLRERAEESIDFTVESRVPGGWASRWRGAVMLGRQLAKEEFVVFDFPNPESPCSLRGRGQRGSPI